MSKMIVVVKEPGKDAEIRSIDDNLASRQKIVGGLIQIVPFFNGNGLEIVCNEEFIFMDFEANVVIDGQILMGTVFITKANDRGEFVSLTQEDARIATMILNRQALVLKR